MYYLLFYFKRYVLSVVLFYRIICLLILSYILIFLCFYDCNISNTFGKELLKFNYCVRSMYSCATPLSIP